MDYNDSLLNNNLQINEIFNGRHTSSNLQNYKDYRIKQYFNSKEIYSSIQYKKNKYRNKERSLNSKSLLSTSISHEKAKIFTVQCPYCFTYINRANGDNLMVCSSDRCKNNSNCFCFLCKSKLTFNEKDLHFPLGSYVNKCVK